MTQQQSNNYKTATAILVGTVIMLTVVIGIVYMTRVIGAVGTVAVKTVSCNAYFDQLGTQQVTQINWGTMPPDSAVNQTIYLKNTGNTACNFTISTSNWNPANAGSWIALTYDLNGVVNVPVNSIVACVLTESISPNISGITNYSYNINVVASG